MQKIRPVGPTSAARALRFNETAFPAGQPPARVIPFRRRGPHLQLPATSSAHAPPQKGGDVILLNKFLESSRSRRTSDKGAIRRAAEPPSDQYIISWLVWYIYVEIMSRGGLRTGMGNRAEFHQKTPVGKS